MRWILTAAILLCGMLSWLSGCGSDEEPREIKGSIFENRKALEIPDRPKEE